MTRRFSMQRVETRGATTTLTQKRSSSGTQTWEVAVRKVCVSRSSSARRDMPSSSGTCSPAANAARCCGSMSARSWADAAGSDGKRGLKINP